MRSARRELRFIMIEIFEPRLRVGRVTLQAVGAEPRLLMVNETLRLIILPMAFITLRRGAGELQCGVACLTGNHSMPSIQLKSSR